MKSYLLIIFVLFIILEKSAANVNFIDQVDSIANSVKQRKIQINSYQDDSEVLLIKGNIRHNKRQSNRLDKLHKDLISIKAIINKDGKLKDNYIQILKNKYKISYTEPDKRQNLRHYFGISIKIFRDNILGNNDVEKKIKTIPEMSYIFNRNNLYIFPFLSMVKFYHKDNDASYEIHQDYLYGIKLGLNIFKSDYLRLVPNISTNYINYSITNDGVVKSGNKNFKAVGLEGLLEVNSEIYFRVSIDYVIKQDKLIKNKSYESLSSKSITSIGMLVKFN